MDNIKKIGKQCVGCRSCEQSCPKQCIHMENNQEGFLYPIVDEEACINCKKCLKVCPMENKLLHRNEPEKVWAIRQESNMEVMDSASGGASDIAAKIILEQKGVVYGAAYDEKLVVHHIEVSDDIGRKRLQSSKYVQSNIGHCYSRAKKHLDKGDKVLFTGTPCQIAGLYSFLGKDYPELYTMDLICHGVPSPKFFEKYLEYQSKKLKENIIYYNFRSKEKRGWGTQYLTKTKTKTKTKTLALDKYGKHFMAGDCYRESCYQCQYANINRVGDITIGDFWGIAKSHPEFYSEKGISSVFVSTNKGKKLFEQMKEFCEVQEATVEEGIVKQGNLVHPTNKPNNRVDFYKNIEDEKFVDQLKVGLCAKERIKAIIPKKIIQKVKSLL